MSADRLPPSAMPERGQRLVPGATIPPPASEPPPPPPPPGGLPPQVIRPAGRGHHVSTRRFELHRDRDISGVSGTGVVADGVVWPDGSVSIRWRGDRPSVVFWHTLDDAEQVHGHGGATRFVWLDDGPASDDAEARGYARAVATLRDDERYDHWWTQMTPDHPEYGYWQVGRRHMADYLETIARVTTPAAPEVTDGQ